MKAAFLFPGQGAQAVGMGKDFYENFSIARETFEEASDILSEDYKKIIFEGPASELMLTKTSQVAIFIVSSALFRVVRKEFTNISPNTCAGLSLGEYTALFAASKISFKECLLLVRDRAKYMHEACNARKGSMMAVLGTNEEQIQTLLKNSNVTGVWVANLNCPKQVVVSGTVEGLEIFKQEVIKNNLGKVIPLDVSGAFHSELMRSAQKLLEPRIMGCEIFESPINIVMNVTGDYVFSIEEIRKFMIEQVTSPVYWERGIHAMANHGIDFYLEIGPGRTLTGMNRKIVPDAKMANVGSIVDLENLSK